LLLYLLRHGETAWNAERRIQGVSQQPLNDIGAAQARALIPAFKGRPVEVVYTSPLPRARETADILAEGLGGLPVREEPGLAELDQGGLEGMVIPHIKDHYNAFWTEWRDHPADARPPGGETLPELQDRAWAAVEDIRARHPEGMVAAVSHNLAITTLLCRILDVEINSMRRIRQHNAAINLIEWDPEREWTVVTMNSLSHLNGSLSSEEKPYL
jgi:broad specificity phosphatase PhoE